jgi:hypothetical protein
LCFSVFGQEGKEVVTSPLRSVVWSLGEEVSKISLFALVSASLFFVDPALAFKVTFCSTYLLLILFLNL